MAAAHMIGVVWVVWFLVVVLGAAYNVRNAWGYFVASLRSSAPSVRFYGGGGLFVAFFLVSAAVCGLSAGMIAVLLPREPEFALLRAVSSTVCLILLGLNLGLAVLADAWTRRTIDRMTEEPQPLVVGGTPPVVEAPATVVSLNGKD